MKEPEYILNPGTRVLTHGHLDSIGGMLIASRHLEMRRPSVIGVVTGIVAGHGGDVYFVMHLGDPCSAAYGFMEFELAPAKEPCPTCKGTGIDWPVSKANTLATACPACGGTAEKTEPPPPPISIYDRMKQNVEDTR
jgi:hypothetical protein